MQGIQFRHKHYVHYLSLVGIFIAAFFGFYLFSFDKMFLVGITVATSSAYVSWGIIHHSIHRDISFAVIMEYITIAVLGSVTVVTLIYRT